MRITQVGHPLEVRARLVRQVDHRPGFAQEPIEFVRGDRVLEVEDFHEIGELQRDVVLCLQLRQQLVITAGGDRADAFAGGLAAINVIDRDAQRQRWWRCVLACGSHRSERGFRKGGRGIRAESRQR